MKRIRDREERRRKRNNIIMGVFLALVMIVSILGYANNQADLQSQSDLSFNGYNFKLGKLSSGESVYIVNIGGQQIGFYNDPVTVQSMNYSGELGNALRNSRTVSMSFVPIPPNEQIPQDRYYYDILDRDLKQFSNRTVLIGYQYPDQFEEVQVINCSDAKAGNPVILVNYTDSGYSGSSINRLADSCFIVSAQGGDIIKFRDYMLYSMLGVYDAK